MSKKKTSTTQNSTQSGTQSSSQNNAFNQNYNNASTNQFGWQNMPDTEDTKALRGFRPEVDPGLGFQYGNAKNKLRSSFIDPMGGYATPQMRDALQRSGERQLNQDQAQAFRGGQYDVNNQRLGQLGSLAALTAPRLTQIGSTESGSSGGTSSGSSTGTSSGTMSGTGTQVQSGDLLGQILGGASQVGSAALL